MSTNDVAFLRKCKVKCYSDGLLSQTFLIQRDQKAYCLHTINPLSTAYVSDSISHVTADN